MHNKKTVVMVAVVVVVVVLVAFFAVERLSGRNVAHAPELSAISGGGVATGTTTSPEASSSGSPAVSAATSSAKSPITVSMEKIYAGSSFSFSYPESWSVLRVRPFSMTNFNGQYVSGDVVPPGGAEIDIVTTTNYGDLKNIMATELMGAADPATSTVTVDNVACDEARYGESYSDGTLSGNIAVYCERGTDLWKMYLSYRKSDPSLAAHVSDFNDVLGSMKFLP
jgi:hypothetical protein